LGGINNLLNTTYYDNIRLNAFGARFYEPAPGRNFYLGFQISLN
jgi:iron complex outermembrane receptor protein